MLKYLLLFTVFLSCQSSSPNEPDLSEEFKDAIKNNDTTLAKKIARRELDKIRSSITDSSFAALMDATTQLQLVEFEISKNRTTEGNNKNSDNTVEIIGDLNKLYTYMIRVYSFALNKSTKTSDIDYYSREISIPREKWINDKFNIKGKGEKKISVLLLQKDIAIASAIINNVDTEETRQQTEESYADIIRMIKER